MIPIEKVKEIIAKHQGLEKKLASGSIDKKKHFFKGYKDIINQFKK